MTIYFIMLGVIGILLFYTRQYPKPPIREYGRGLRPLFMFDVLAGAVAMILILIAGLRYHVGSDYNNYIAVYEARSVLWMDYALSWNEPGFALLCKLSSMIYDDGATLIFLSSAITIGLYMYVIQKRAEYYAESVLLFILMGVWSGTFGAIRQYIAAAIVFWGHHYIAERKLAKFLLVVFFAYLFHETALVMIPVYFLAQNKVSAKSLLLTVACLLVVRYSYDLIFQLMDASTDYNYMTTEVNSFRIVVATAPVVFLVLNPMLHGEGNIQLYSMMMVINSMFVIATSGSAYLARVGIYTGIYSVLAIPQLLRGYDQNSQKWMKPAVYSLYFLYFVYEIVFSGRPYAYQFVFNR